MTLLNSTGTPKKVVLLGSTGSIGQSTAEVVRALPKQINLIGLSGYHNTKRLAELTTEFLPEAITTSTEEEANQLRKKLERRLGKKTPSIFHGEEGLLQLATLPESDILLMAITGTAGLIPTVAAIRAGKDIAIASKEILVMAGPHILQHASLCGTNILPVDSEHNAIFQCLEGAPQKSIKRLILTCSGGPFRNSTAKEISRATPEEALAHPTWKMGKKISIDSATLFNKALEMIEAHFLFGIPMEQIEVVIHPESIIHSMVEFIDGSVIAQMSHHSMTLPIQYALTYPERLPSPCPSLDLTSIGKLQFIPPNEELFPALQLARQAVTEGGAYPAVLNAANEAAVELFLAGKISFPEITRLVEKALDGFFASPAPSLEELIVTDREVRKYTKKLLERRE